MSLRASGFSWRSNRYSLPLKSGSKVASSFFRFIENVPRKDFDAETFKREYAVFADFLNPTGKARIVLSSGFWEHEGDAAIRTVAVERGYPFVELGDLGERDEMKAIGLFEHTGVANHPGDRGMKAIAERLWNAV